MKKNKNASTIPMPTEEEERSDRFRSRRRLLPLFMGLFALLTVLLLPVSASAKKVTVAPKSAGPSNVLKAQKVYGSWVLRNGKYTFFQQNGKQLKGTWFLIGNDVYLVNGDGYRVTGWVEYRGNRYYLRKSNGRLLTGWLSKTYYFKKSNGRMLKSGIHKIDGDSYYFKNGKKQTGAQTVDGYNYYFSSAGKMAKDKWVKISGKYRYFAPDGKMATLTWLSLSGYRYYVDADGVRLTGRQQIEGAWYTFNSRGELTTGTSTVDPEKPMVALTFDDGPSIYTPRLLAALKKYNAKATFFMVGDRVLTYSDSVRQMLEYGCELGNHSLTHTSMTTLSLAEIESEFSTTSRNIYSVCGRYPTVARLPYGDGHGSSAILNAIGLPSIYWSLDTEDWRNTGSSIATINAVMDNVKSGDIILMHDLYQATISAVETIIPALQERGFQLVTVSELARYKGNTTLAVGRTYYGF